MRPVASVIPAMSATESREPGFTVYPAIDVRAGEVVRLAQGDYARETRYRGDPFELACEYAEAGANWLHLVDLDAARMGQYTLLPLVEKLSREAALEVQTGGGVRQQTDVEALLTAGAARVVIGTLAVTHAATVIEWIKHFGPDRICVAIDVRRDANGRWFAATHGWTASSAADALPLITYLAANGLRHLLSTDIERDGMLSGPALDWYGELAQRVPGVRVQASGGIRSVEDVKAARSAGCHGAIIGRALLEGRIDLPEALAC